MCGHASRLFIYAPPRGLQRYGRTGGKAFDRVNNELLKGGKAPAGIRRCRGGGTDGLVYDRFQIKRVQTPW